MRLLSCFLALALSTSAALAGDPLSPGAPAGVKRAQMSDSTILYGALGVGAVAGFIVALTKDFVLEDQTVQAFLNINNLFDNDGPITGGFNGSPGMLYPTPTYADVIGRYFTLGVRFSL